MSRSKWKGIFFYFFNNDTLIFFSRRFCISKKFLNKKIEIYNGKSLKSFIIKDFHIGQKIGDLFVTRNFSNKNFLKKKKN